MKHMLDDLGNSTKYMVVVSKATGLMRRVICSSKEENYKCHVATMHPGETDVYLTHKEWEDFKNPAEMHDAVAQKVGHPHAPPHEKIRHAVANEHGFVYNVVVADMTCGDTGEMFGHNHQLIQDHKLEIGQRVGNRKK